MAPSPLTIRTNRSAVGRAKGCRNGEGMPEVCPTRPPSRSGDHRSPATTVAPRMATRRGAYPGTFNPPTVAHLAVALAARSQCGLDRVELVLSEVPLGKVGDPQLTPIEVRLSMLE